MDAYEANKEAGEGGGAQSVDRALSLLSFVSRFGDEGVSIAAIVAETGLSRPTVRRLLLALIRANLVEQDETSRRYFLGEEAFVLGILASPPLRYPGCGDREPFGAFGFERRYELSVRASGRLCGLHLARRG